jgi:heme oxygenase (biliverdin-IX-beta and delta-forming)
LGSSLTSSSRENSPLIGRVRPAGRREALSRGLRRGGRPRNLLADARASLLVTQPGSTEDALAAGRVTLMGRARHLTAEEGTAARPVYVGRHPEPASWVDFEDFGFWRLDVSDVYMVGGFATMDWVSADAYRLAEVDPLADAAAGIVEHMNRDHADALLLLARWAAGLAADEATMVAVDRLGFKLRLRSGSRLSSARLAFPREVRSPEQCRVAPVEMIAAARSALERKEMKDIDDQTLILADIARKALVQVQVLVRDLLLEHMTQEKAESLGGLALDRDLDPRLRDHRRGVQAPGASGDDGDAARCLRADAPLPPADPDTPLRHRSAGEAVDQAVDGQRDILCRSVTREGFRAQELPAGFGHGIGIDAVQEHDPSRERVGLAPELLLLRRHLGRLEIGLAEMGSDDPGPIGDGGQGSTGEPGPQRVVPGQRRPELEGGQAAADALPEARRHAAGRAPGVAEERE